MFLKVLAVLFLGLESLAPSQALANIDAIRGPVPRQIYPKLIKAHCSLSLHGLTQAIAAQSGVGFTFLDLILEKIAQGSDGRLTITDRANFEGFVQLDKNAEILGGLSYITHNLNHPKPTSPIAYMLSPTLPSRSRIERDFRFYGFTKGMPLRYRGSTYITEGMYPNGSILAYPLFNPGKPEGVRIPYWQAVRGVLALATSGLTVGSLVDITTFQSQAQNAKITGFDGLFAKVTYSTPPTWRYGRDDWYFNVLVPLSQIKPRARALLP